MNSRFAITWVLGHGFITAALFAIGVFLPGDAATGCGFYALPIVLGAFQSYMLRPHICAWLWIPLSIVGFFASFLFMWFFIPAIGFTMSLAQSFCFRTRPRLFTGALWTVLGTSGWIAGIVLGGKIMPNDGPQSGLILYVATTLIYSAFLLPGLFLLHRRQTACPAPPESPNLPP